VAASELKPAYIVSGDDRPKVEVALERLRARFDPGAIERLVAAGGASGDDVVAVCNAGSLLGDARLVLVTEVDGRRDDRRRLTSGWKAADVEAVVEYLRAPAPGTILCLVGEELKADSALGKAVAKIGDVLVYAVGKDIDGWIAKRFRESGVAIEREACHALHEIVGDEKLVLDLEIDKLVTWAGGEPIGRREVEQIAVSAGDTFVWALTDAWGDRDLPRVLAACELLLERRAKEPFAVASALASYVGRVRAAQAMAEEGLPTAEVAKRLKIKEYPARKALGHARNYTRDELDTAVVRLAELDAALKGASRLGAELQLERTLVELSQARHPTPA